MARVSGVEVSVADTGILGHVINDGFGDGDVIVDERCTFVLA